MTGIPLCVVPASLYWVLELPPLAQSDTICVLSRGHKLVPSNQERYPWTPSHHSSSFPVEFSKFENITSLERKVLLNVFNKDLSWVGIRETDAVIPDTVSTSLVANLDILCLNDSTKNLCASFCYIAPLPLLMTLSMSITFLT